MAARGRRGLQEAATGRRWSSASPPGPPASWPACCSRFDRRGPARAGLTLPGLLLQESWRLAFRAEGKPAARPSPTTSCGRLALVTAIAILVLTGHTKRRLAHARLGRVGHRGRGRRRGPVAAGPGGLPGGLVAAGASRPGPPSPRESLGLVGASQFRLYGLAALAGLAAAGSLRAAELLLSPVVLPSWSWPPRPRIPPRCRARRRRAGCARSGLFVAVAGAAGRCCGGWRCCCCPTPSGGAAARLVLAARLPAPPAGDPGRGRLRLPAGAWIGMRPFGAVRRAGAPRGRVGPVPVRSLGGAALGGAAGAAWGSAAGTLAGAAIWWWELHRAMANDAGDGRGAEPAYTRSSQISRQYG